ncbi:MAG: hypothetical protein FWE13_04660 [Firmicutes bacterium]|nr:hypothetical protein [Bacillota bacterium]
MNNNQITSRRPFGRFIIFACVISLALILIGGTIFTIALARVDFNFRSLDNEELTASHMYTYETVDRIELNGSSWRYRIEMGEYFSINYFTSSIVTITATKVSNARGNYTFRLEENRDGNWFVNNVGFGINGIRRSDEDYLIVITIANPVAVEINGSATRVTTEGLDFNGFEINGSSVRINLTDVNIWGNLDVSGSNMNMNLTRVTAHRITTNGSASNLIFNDVEVSGNVSTTGSSTRINWTSGNSDRFIASGSSVRMDLDQVVVRSVSMTGANNHITTKRSDMSSLAIIGSSARATLELVGSIEMIRQVNITGSAGRIYFSGVRHSAQNWANITDRENSFKTFSITGSSGRIRLNMLGGESTFNQ